MDGMNTTNLTASYRDIASTLPLAKAGQSLRLYWLPVIVILGLPGNILSCLIMLKPHNRRISCCTYMAGLAVTDSLVLLIVAEYWTLEFDRPYVPIQCNILVWLLQIVYVSGTLFLVAMTVDRYVAVCHPFKAKIFNSPKRARIVVVCIVAGTSVYTVPYFFTSQWLPEARICVGIARQDTLSQAYGWLTTCVTSFAPFLTLLTLNVCIIRAVRCQGTAVQQKCTTRENRERQLVVMLLVATFTFLALTMPYVIRNATATLWNYEGMAERYAAYTFVVQLSAQLYFSNNAVNFYLYCLVGRKFRYDVKRMCCFWSSSKPEEESSDQITESTKM